jgi:hypothetical protein
MGLCSAGMQKVTDSELASSAPPGICQNSTLMTQQLLPTRTFSIQHLSVFLLQGFDSMYSVYRLVPCDAVNRNKVFNTSTRLYFSSLSLHVSAPTGHPQVRYTIGCFNGLPSNATDPLHVRDPMWRCYMLHISALTLHSQYRLSHRNK